MSKRNKIVVSFIVFLILVFIISALVVAFYGKKFVELQIENKLKMKATIEKIRLSPPFTITIQKLKLGDLFEAERISFSPNIFGFFAGKVVLDGLTVVEPIINLVQSPEGSLNLPQLKAGGKQPEIFLTGLHIRRGVLNFTDKKIGSPYFTVKLGGVNADVSKVIFPLTSLNAKFNFSANILTANNKQLGIVKGNGWVDFIHKGMDAVLECNELEAVYFYPYYGSLISSRKLSSAKADIRSQFKSKNNDLDILSNLKLYKIIYAEVEPAEDGTMPAPDLTRSTLDLFTDKQGNLNLDFKIKTKFDNPQITAKEIKKEMLNAAMRNLASQDPEDIAEKITNVIEQFKDFGKGMEGIFKKKE